VAFTLLCIGLLILIPIGIGVAYLVRNSKEKVVETKPATPKKADPVTLDRSPEMPHRPGATS
jgi:hypothetical protein